MSKTRYAALIVAAGRGERAGSQQPKQFRTLAGKPVIVWSVERFLSDPNCEAILIAHSPGACEQIRAVLGTHGDSVHLYEGGQTRSQSVEALLAHCQSERVLVHDAARPLLSQRLIDDLVTALADSDGATPALPVIDALVREEQAGLAPVDRSALYRVQTPQGFETSKLKAAFASHGSPDFPDEVSLARAAGLSVKLVPGEESNLKLTWPEDFERAERMIEDMAGEHRRASRQSVTGMGYDVHRMAPGDGMHLCGVFIDCPFQLVGHSDADVGLHTITDALLGATGLGDIGDHFPPSDDQWKGADSALFLDHARKLAEATGAQIIHVDVTLICERPKIGPHKAAMKHRVGELLGLAGDRVNIKATTTEKLGFTGRGEGIAAEAVITVSIPG